MNFWDTVVYTKEPFFSTFILFFFFFKLPGNIGEFPDYLQASQPTCQIPDFF